VEELTISHLQDVEEIQVLYLQYETRELVEALLLQQRLDL
jgi:hypothetical protein